MKRHALAIVILSVGLVPFLALSAGLYVDSQAASSGNGTQESPFATIQEGVNAANAGDTVYLRGSLFVTQALQCVVVPADKTELMLAKWGADRFSIEVDNDFMKNMANKASTNIITVCAQSNTISGLEFIYHKTSLGLDKYGKGSFIFFRTNYQTVADCRFYRPSNEATPGYAGVDRLISGQSWGGNQNNSYGQSYMTIRNCVFENTIGFRGDTHKYPIGIGDYATIANCMFSNCWSFATAIQNGKFNNHTIVSNVLILAAMDAARFLAPAEQMSGVFTSAFGGMGKGEIAYNVFVGRNRDFPLFNYGRNDGFNSGKISFHHNTVIGFDCLFSGGKTGGWDTKTQDFKPNIFGENKASLDFFDNIIDANVLFFENATNVAHQLSAIKAGSVLRNNAVCLTNNNVIATGKATESEMYNLFDKLTITNNLFLSNLPEFVETNDVYSADFYRPKLRRGKGVDLDRIGWTGENGEYPRFIGALEPIVTGSFTIRLR